jgi:hypothetical protein
MAERLTDGLVRELAAPAVGNRITYDLDVKQQFSMRLSRCRGNGGESRIQQLG